MSLSGVFECMHVSVCLCLWCVCVCDIGDRVWMFNCLGVQSLASDISIIHVSGICVCVFVSVCAVCVCDIGGRVVMFICLGVQSLASVTGIYVSGVCECVCVCVCVFGVCVCDIGSRVFTFSCLGIVPCLCHRHYSCQWQVLVSCTVSNRDTHLQMQLFLCHLSKLHGYAHVFVQYAECYGQLPLCAAFQPWPLPTSHHCHICYFSGSCLLFITQGVGRRHL